jgi:hypothetical protein
MQLCLKKVGFKMIKKINILITLLFVLFLVSACEFETIDTNEETIKEETTDITEEITGEMPVINGLVDLTLEVGSIFEPLLDITASDLEDGDLTDQIDIIGLDGIPILNNVLMATGEYTLTYKITDSDQNVFEQTITITIILQQDLACTFVYDGYQITFCDDFNGLGSNLNSNLVDLSKWGFQLGTGSQYGLTGWGNNERQFYRSENARVENGNLVIEAKMENFGGMPYTSARLWTQPTFSQKYGRFEASISLPVGTGLWPAFWLMPQDSVYGGWANSGEIDIMEARGRLPNEVSSAIHYGGSWPNNQYQSRKYQFPIGITISDFNLYSVEWEETELRFYVNNILYYTITDWYNTGYDFPAPFDQRFHIILNLAVGGTFDRDRLPDPQIFEEEVLMIVEYVRVYQKIDS